MQKKDHKAAKNISYDEHVKQYKKVLQNQKIKENSDYKAYEKKRREESNKKRI